VNTLIIENAKELVASGIRAGLIAPPDPRDILTPIEMNRVKRAETMRRYRRKKRLS
jgi:hypothetical protein